MLFWQLLSEKEPYENVKTDLDKHVMNGLGPDLSVITGREKFVQLAIDCISRCWSQVPDDRPAFAELNKEFTRISEISYRVKLPMMRGELERKMIMTECFLSDMFYDGVLSPERKQEIQTKYAASLPAGLQLTSLPAHHYASFY